MKLKLKVPQRSNGKMWAQFVNLQDKWLLINKPSVIVIMSDVAK